MEISPQQVRTAEFKAAKRGLDPDEVRTFLNEVAAGLERAQNQSAAMEARARAAVARLQEISENSSSSDSAQPDAGSSAQETDASEAVSASVDEAETISRTLLLAQRTADTTVAEATAEAERIEREAQAEADETMQSTRDTSERLLDEAREQARQAGEEERVTVKAEVDALRARRDFLESDVDHLERHLSEERSRLREAATTVLELTERVPGGLGEVRAPLLSASHDDTPNGIADNGAGDDSEQLQLADDGDAADDAGFDEPGEASGSGAELDDTVGIVIQTDIADDQPGNDPPRS